MADVFHIRKQLRKLGGTRFYKDKGLRATETLCGAELTSYDVRLKDKAVSWAEHSVCQECLFRKALATLPVGGFDPFSHKTVEDLKSLARFELDLYDEGDDGAAIKSRKEYARVKRWVDNV
jgi:hypothetical protein